jgi:hypothetical protein
VTAGGEQEKMVKGRNTMLFAIFGLIIAILAGVITNIVFEQFI